MNKNDLWENRTYTDNHGRYRKILWFDDDFNGNRMVVYEKGAFLHEKWYRFPCTDNMTIRKENFARWAKKVLE